MQLKAEHDPCVRGIHGTVVGARPRPKRQSTGARGVGENRERGAECGRGRGREREPETPLACELPEAGPLFTLVLKK